MKNILAIVLIVCLPAIAFFQYQNYQRYQPPSAFAYTPSTEIDLDYHDPSVLAAYYQLAAGMDSYGRYCWKEYQVDVKTDQPHDAQKKALQEAYVAKEAELKHMEALLLRSAQRKAKGYNNAAIQIMDQEGLSEEEYEVRTLLGGKQLLEFDDQGAAVHTIQQLLKDRGYELPVDGYFERHTLAAVKQYQEDNKLYPTGRVGDLTAKHLLNKQ